MFSRILKYLALELVIKYTNCTTSTGNATEDLEVFAYPDGTAQCHLTFAITDNYTVSPHSSLVIHFHSFLDAIFVG